MLNFKDNNPETRQNRKTPNIGGKHSIGSPDLLCSGRPKCNVGDLSDYLILLKRYTMVLLITCVKGNYPICGKQW